MKASNSLDTDKARIEPFNSRVRNECLNQHWFRTLADAAEKLEAWRRSYNEEWPRGAIGNKFQIMLTATNAPPGAKLDSSAFGRSNLEGRIM